MLILGHVIGQLGCCAECLNANLVPTRFHWLLFVLRPTIEI